MIPQEIQEIFHAGGHRMILANSSYSSGTALQNNQLSTINQLVKAVDPNGVISGEGAMTKDLIQVARHGFQKCQYNLYCCRLDSSLQLFFVPPPFRFFWLV